METLVTVTELTSLVREARDGDTGAFGEVVRRTQDGLIMAARALIGDAQHAEDAVQEAFVAAHRRLGQLRDPARFRPWISRILTRIALARRKRPRVGRLGDRDGLVPAREAPDHARLEALTAEVARLPDKYRTPLALHYLAGLSYRDVAAVLDVSEKRVKSRLHDARAMIRRRLGDGQG